MNDLELVLMHKLGKGGGGTSDYNALTNKPSINNHVLAGDQSSADLGIVEPRLDTATGNIYFGADLVGRKLSKPEYDALATKLDIYYLTFQPAAPTRETKINEQLKELIEDPLEWGDKVPDPEPTKGGDGE